MFQGSLFQCFIDVSPDVSALNPRKYRVLLSIETFNSIEDKNREIRGFREIMYFSNLSKSSHLGIIYARARGRLKRKRGC